MSAQPAFETWLPEMGHLSLRPVRPREDARLIHDWVSRGYARYWGMQDQTREQVAAFYRDMAASPHADAFIGLHEGEPAFLMERYAPESEPVSAHYRVRPGDCGMHVLVAPPERRIPGFTWAVFTTVMDFLFDDPAVERIVVEPDVFNDKIHALNLRAGFEYVRRIRLPDKTAWLAFCTRAQYRAALRGEAPR